MNLDHANCFRLSGQQALGRFSLRSTEITSMHRCPGFYVGAAGQASTSPTETSLQPRYFSEDEQCQDKTLYIFTPNNQFAAVENWT